MSVETSQAARPRFGARVWRHFKRNFLGYVALVVAISMTPLPAYAASKIGAKQLKKNAVTTVKIKDGAVTTPKLAAKAVTSDKVAGDAITSEKIKDGSVSAADLASGTAYKDVIVKRTDVASVANGTTSRVDVMCPSGYVATGGGASSGGVNNTGVLHVSAPVTRGFLSLILLTADGSAPRGWRTELLVTGGSAQTVYHFAICASK